MTGHSSSFETLLLGGAVLALSIGGMFVLEGDLVFGGGIVALGVVATVAAATVEDAAADELTGVVQRAALLGGVGFFLAPLPSRFGTGSEMRPMLGAAMLAVGAATMVFRRAALDRR